jgi:ferredoxin
MFYDLNDPATKALYDSYGEDEKEDFETAYVYMKYLKEFISTTKEAAFNLPPIPEIADLPPDVVEKMQVMLMKIAQGVMGGPETDPYHGKVIQPKNARQLVTQKVDVNLEVPETIVPYKLARNVILKNPAQAIAVGPCPCRTATPGSSCIPDPKEVCLFLGDPHVSFIVAHNPKFHRISQEKAISILDNCYNRGFVACSYFKKDMGNRLYAICNCCACCCGSIKMTNLFLDGVTDFSSLAPSGLVAEIGDDCIGCGACVDKCQFRAISLNSDKSRAKIDLYRCMGCGVCEGQCPAGAITFRAEPSKGGILDLEELKKNAGY